VNEGDGVTVSTDHGSVDIPVSIDDTIRDARVFLSNNFEQKGVLGLMNYTIDPITKAPGIEGCEVKITSIQGKTE
jgi:predicted molibdopterin-dependent oxidoreductase YjgC